MALPLASRLRLKPLVRISRVFPSGLMAVVMGWSTVNSGRSCKSGFRGSKVEPGAAIGVMLMPVGNFSGEDELCFWSAANDRPHASRMQVERQPRFRAIIAFPSQLNRLDSILSVVGSLIHCAPECFSRSCANCLGG